MGHRANYIRNYSIGSNQILANALLQTTIANAYNVISKIIGLQTSKSHLYAWSMQIDKTSVLFSRVLKKKSGKIRHDY